MKTNTHLLMKTILSIFIMIGLTTFFVKLTAQPMPLPERVISFKTSLPNESEITIRTNLWNPGEVWIYCGNGVWQQHTDSDYGSGNMEKSYVIKNNAEELGIYGAVKDFTIADGGLVSINLSGNPRYRNVTLSNNNLTHVELSYSDKVVNVSIENNETLNSLTYESPLPTVSTIKVNNSSINNLDLSGYPNLKKLVCHNSTLTQLDLSSNSQINHIECYSNKITGVNMTSMMQSLPSTGGELYVYNSKADPEDANKALVSDVEIAKNKNWAVYDLNGDYDESIEYSGVSTSSSQFKEEGLNIWSSKGTLHINNAFHQIGKFIEIYSVSGEMIRQEVFTKSEIEVILPAGLYLVRIEGMSYKTVIF